MKDLLREYFDDMVVYKDLQKSNFFSALSLPAFLRDWLLRRFADDNGRYDISEVERYVHEYVPKQEDWIHLKDRIINQRQKVKFLAKIGADIDIRTGEVSFYLPEFGLDKKDTLIEPDVWDEIKGELAAGREVWGIVELGYKPFLSKTQPGRLRLLRFQNFCPYVVDLDYYREVSRHAPLDQWLDVILGAIDYSAAGYENETQKLTMISRLLPFVEKRVHLVELAPKGTGKSYLFGRVSKYGWLSTGGTLSRAKMFYDQNTRKPGIVCGHDFVALDEVQTISFTNVAEMRASLKGYMESGVFTVGSYEGSSNAGIVLLGNIPIEDMNEHKNLFSHLPQAFCESALLDRFHGFIKGWDIPRMHDGLKINDWAINSEYFSEIMHLLREDFSYRALVDELILVPPQADTRDTEAIKRLCTGFLKLLFPYVRKAEDLDLRAFRTYCLKPSIRMRETIVYQMGLMDQEFKGKNLPKLRIRGLNT